MSTEPEAKKLRVDEPNEINIGACLELAKQVARECGALVKRAFAQSDRSVQFKGTIDLVTETDQEVEKRIFGAIKAAFPLHKLIGEETVAGGGSEELSDAPTWIVDPIDGTTNCQSGSMFVVAVAQR